MSHVDEANAAFWEELCGSALAREVGVTDCSPKSLRRFDDAYFAIYPYLVRHLEPVLERRGRTLEIGLGYGTVGGHLAGALVDYHGLDVARGPVEMMRSRLLALGQPARAQQVVQGSALAIPWPDRYFDAVVSIGCLHHTGHLALGVQEVRRVLVTGGVAMVMVYNRNSLRQLLVLRPHEALARLRGRTADETTRAAYDFNAAGQAAPFTEFTSAGGIRALFSGFQTVSVVRENMESIPRLGIPRERLLGWPARILGLDLYVTAVK